MNELAAMLGERGPMEIYRDYQKKKIPVGPPVYPQYPNSLRDMMERVLFMKEWQKPRMVDMTVRG